MSGCSSSRSTATLSPCTTLKTPSGSPASLPEVGDPQRRRRVLLAGLEDDGVAGGDRDREEPHRDHRREVERADHRHRPEGLADRVHVDAGGGVLGEAALDQVRHAAGELHDLLAAADLAQGVGEHLAVLGGDDLGQLALAGVRAARGTRTAPSTAWPATCPARRGTPRSRPRPRRRPRRRTASATWPVTWPVAGSVTGAVRPEVLCAAGAVDPVRDGAGHDSPRVSVEQLSAR